MVWVLLPAIGVCCSFSLGVSVCKECMGTLQRKNSEMFKSCSRLFHVISLFDWQTFTAGVGAMGSDYLGNLECSKQILFWTYTNPSQVYSWWRNWFSTGVSKAGGCSITWLKALIEYWFVLLLLSCMVTICISLHTCWSVFLCIICWSVFLCIPLFSVSCSLCIQFSCFPCIWISGQSYMYLYSSVMNKISIFYIKKKKKKSPKTTKPN